MTSDQLLAIWNDGACQQCRHFHGDSPTCEAYPDGIPLAIISGNVNHITAQPGDHGVLFDPIVADSEEE